MKNTIFTIAILLFCSATANAVVEQTVKLKNGSVLNGYIKEQDKQDNITFSSENATICVNGSGAYYNEHKYNIGSLETNNPQWIKWAEANNAFIGDGTDRTLTLTDINFSSTSGSVASEVYDFDSEVKSKNIHDVRLIEKGFNIKYIELTPNTYKFNWKDVESISSEKRSKEAVSGINRVYTVKTNGTERTISGQYAGESYNTVSLYTDDGLVETINLDDVQKYAFVGVNPNQSIIEQSSLLDVVKVKNPSYNVYKGLIIERNYIDKNYRHLVIQLEDGSTKSIQFADILGYSREENSNLVIKNDIILKSGEVYINDSIATAYDVQKYDNKVIIRTNSIDLEVKGNGEKTEVTVQYYNPSNQSDKFILLGLDYQLVKKSNRKIPIYSFSTNLYDMTKFQPVSVEYTVNKNTKLKYSLEVGDYTLYNMETKEAIPFTVTFEY